MPRCAAGFPTLSGSSDSLDEGAKEIVDTIFTTATTQLRAKLVSSGLMTEAQAAQITLTRSNYVTVFQQLSSAATVTAAQVEAQLRANLSAMTTAQEDLTLTIAFDLMSADSSLSYTDAVTQAAQIMSDAAHAQTAIATYNNDTWKAANYDLILQVAAATGTDTTTAAQIAMIAYYLDSTAPTGKISEASTILSNAAIVNSTTTSTEKISALCTAVASAATSTGNTQLDAVKDQLDEVMQFYNGLLSYTDGVDSAYAGAKKLASGASSLADGADELYSGIYTLYTGSKELVSGVGDLQDGCLELKDGTKNFYDDGIEKLVDALGGDYEGLIDRLSAVAGASKDYQSFAGIIDGMTGSVKFIYRTDSINY